MDAITFLDSLIHGDAKLPLEPIGTNSTNYKIKLIEPDQTDSSVTITGHPQQSFVVKVDRFVQPGAIFKGSRGECKRSDYFIVSETDTFKGVIFIELKRTKESEKSIIEQLKGAHCFFHYCEKVGEIFWSEKNIFKSFQVRFVSFSHTSKEKRKTMVDRGLKNNSTPETLRKISGAKTVHFSNLI